MNIELLEPIHSRRIGCKISELTFDSWLMKMSMCRIYIVEAWNYSKYKTDSIKQVHTHQTAETFSFPFHFINSNLCRHCFRLSHRTYFRVHISDSIHYSKRCQVERFRAKKAAQNQCAATMVPKITCKNILSIFV